MPPVKRNKLQTAYISGFLSISPMLFFFFLFIATFLITGDFYKISLSALFCISSIYAVFTLRHKSIAERIKIFSRGAGQENLMLMIWIFILAGEFAQTAKDIGAIDSVVKVALYFFPSQLILAGMFITSCFVSLSIGTSVGTVAALVPISVGIANSMGEPAAIIVASVVGGAFFGDNLSFISDTTIASTKTQGCELNDKFKANFLIALPAAIITVALYVFISNNQPHEFTNITFYDLIKTLPYIVVLTTAICGMNVFTVLTIGNLLTGIAGISLGILNIENWMASLGNGIISMGELIIISMLAGGMLEIIRENGGINFIIDKISRRINSKRAGELAIGAMVGITNVCTANNTVAIISVGKIAKDLSRRFNINPCKSASILDTFSCVVQGLIPYGAQILMASALSRVQPIGILSYMYYPIILGTTSIICILVRFPRKYS